MTDNRILNFVANDELKRRSITGMRSQMEELVVLRRFLLGEKMNHSKDKSVSPDAGSLDDLMGNYSLSLKALNRSQRTIDWYLDILRKYFGFLSHSNMLKPVDQMGSQELQAYLLHLQERNRWPENKYIESKGKLSPFSIQGHARAIKAFWGWLFREGLIGENPLAKFPLPKVPPKII